MNKALHAQVARLYRLAKDRKAIEARESRLRAAILRRVSAPYSGRIGRYRLSVSVHAGGNVVSYTMPASTHVQVAYR